MLRRGLAFCTTLAMASVVQAGAIITLVPKVNGLEVSNQFDANLSPLQLINVDIMLTNDGADTADHALRFLQFDLNNTDPALFDCTNAALGGCVTAFATHVLACANGVPGAASGTVWIFDFSDTPLCAGDPASCGCGHFMEQLLNGPRTNVVSSTYYFTDPADLGQNLNAQRILPGNGTSLKIGELLVRIPAAAGTYTLDVMNAVANGGPTNPDLGGADVRWGFGTNINGEPLTTWRSGSGLTGGTLDLVVGGPTCPNFVSATPACDSSLPRTQDNVARIAYDGAIPDPTGCVGVEIFAIDAAGNDVGGDLSGGFSCSADGPNTLRMQENGTVLTNTNWYRVSFCGTTVVYSVLWGDANNDGINDTGDLSFVFAKANTPPVGDDDPHDINNDGIIDTGDLSAGFAFVNLSVSGTRPSAPPCP